jgi:glycosyltransferase involved in cell wall biosynthesis
MSLSIIVITKNEEAAIGNCLSSIAWADEIIVVDSGSTDRTEMICRQYTDNFYTNDWPGFGPQKNRALELATNEWVLSLDADEMISPELRLEIESVMNNPKLHSAFAIPRRSSYCGKFMHHGGWWPDYVTRLFRKDSARFSNDLIHERIIVTGSLGRLKHPIIHDAFRDIEEVLETINRYSTIGAKMMHEREKRGTLSKAIFHGFWSFFQTYVVRAGFLDGREGFMLAVSNAEGTYYRYLKLMLLEEKMK